MDYLSTSVISLKGVGEKSAKLFEKLNIQTYGDLLFYFPRDYEEFPPIRTIAQCRDCHREAVYAVVANTPAVKRVRNLSIMVFTIKDATGQLQATIFNMPYLRSTLVPGKRFVFYGKVSNVRGRMTLEQPQLYSPEEYQKLADTLQPRYSLTKGITNNMIQKCVKAVMEQGVVLKDPLPESVREQYSLEAYQNAVREIHFPQDKTSYLHARERLVFQEFLSFLLQTRIARASEKKILNEHPMIEVADTERLLEALPYQLTGAQTKVWEQVRADLQSEYAMNRLIQGDVGSGKTIIAVLALLMTAVNGYQGAMMAPTEVLANQHYETILMLKKTYRLAINPILLSGSLSAKEKREAHALIESGAVNVVIGTQALIQNKVNFSKLALVVTDEQHRFGVRQRETLAEKGNSPHILVMSATPIPRTLAIILFGDLSISVIDEYPKNRIPIKNCIIHEDKRREAYHFIEKQVAEGRQAYIICPMVDTGVMEELENVVDYTEKLRAVMPETIQIAFLHGKMKNAEKNSIMDAFTRGDIDILVSTTVIEVGIDVPNATVIMIENSERFGLAALHQLRGRVGRGSHQSYCIFVSESRDEHAMERLNTLMKSNDGFFIASEDMKLRGPGDVFGIRQSGVLAFRLGDIYQDSELLGKASECCDYLMHEEEALEQVLADMQSVNQAMVDFRTI